MKRRLISSPLIFALFATFLISALRADGQEELADKIDLKRFPGEMVDKVIIPIPSEVFAVLDKFAKTNWRNEVLMRPSTKLRKREEIALLLGVTVADGFVAVEAEDRKAVEHIGSEVLRLSDSIGIKDEIQKHANAIMDAAKEDKWDDVRQQLDKTQTTVRETMEKKKDEQLAQCVSIGGWLRGTEVVTKIVAATYSPEKAGVLQQPKLVKYFNDELGKMRVLFKGDLKKVKKGLKEIDRLMDKSGGVLSPPDVAQMHQITAELVSTIVTK